MSTPNETITLTAAKVRALVDAAKDKLAVSDAKAELNAQPKQDHANNAAFSLACKIYQRFGLIGPVGEKLLVAAMIDGYLAAQLTTHQAALKVAVDALEKIRNSSGDQVMVCTSEGHSECVHRANAALAQLRALLPKPDGSNGAGVTLP